MKEFADAGNNLKKKEFFTKLSPSNNPLKGMKKRDLELSFINHMEFSLAKDAFSATKRDCFRAAALSVRDRMIERWTATQQAYYKDDVKRVNYLSMEFLMGRTLGNALINLDLYDVMSQALQDLGVDLDEITDMESDAALGNGGLGRLAACFLDSLATLEIPAYGYGLRYEYGIFSQKFSNGEQIEYPDNWLRYGNPWEIERPEHTFLVNFYGRVIKYTDKTGRVVHEWIETDDVVAMAYDTPVPGFRNNTVNHLRLWSAKSGEEFNLDFFNHGDYHKAVSDKVDSETISKVLYPKDDIFEGMALRLKQEYFLVSATIQDILRRYKNIHNDLSQFPEKVAIQLNDTHPALAIPELMRIFIDTEGLNWDLAWDITVKTFGYTNHTLLPEALEHWDVKLFEVILPRHLQIIYEINRRFLEHISIHCSDDSGCIARLSLIQEGERKRVRMAHLAIIGSHSVNGVAALHSHILKTQVFSDFSNIWPEKFTNKTNGITQRRWLLLCNKGLSHLLNETIGTTWQADLFTLKDLAQYSADKGFQEKWKKVKQENKDNLAKYIKEKQGIIIDPGSLFDCQIKRIHEYKRQLLNVLHIITLYSKIKSEPHKNRTPRTFIFAGKAAPGYAAAKMIIRLINSVASYINNDPQVGTLLKVSNSKCGLLSYLANELSYQNYFSSQR